MPPFASEQFHAITSASPECVWNALTATGVPLDYLYGMTVDTDWQPGAKAPASRIRHHTRKRAVKRTVGTTPTQSAICTRTNPQARAQPTTTGPGRSATPHAHTRPPSRFPQLRLHPRLCPQRPGDARIPPTHSPRHTADGLCNRSLSRQKPVTQGRVTGSDMQKRVAGVGFEPT